jgi:hypothetical protein
MTPSRLLGPLTDRDLDVLDLAIIDAMMLEALGPNSDALRIDHPAGGPLTAELTPLGRSTLREMSVTTGAGLEGWLELLTVSLVEQTVAVVGEQWRAETELGVELACAERCDDMAVVAQLAIAGPLVVDGSRELTDILAASACDPELVAFL